MEYDLVVIGAGPGGYVAAIRAAQLGLKTACVEKDPNLGGTCLNVGCIPSKSLLHSSELYHQILHGASDHGIDAKPTLDFNKMMMRKKGVVERFNRGIEMLFQKNGVTKIIGEGRFKDANTLEVNGEEIKAKNFLIATGSEPTPLPFLPFDEKQVLSSTGALALTEVPKKMVVIGAGVIGVELGSVYARLGTEVEFVEFLDRVCPPLDATLSKEFKKILEKQGLKFRLSTKVTEAKVEKEVTLQFENGESVTAEKVLVCIGRKPYTKNVNLAALGIETNRGMIPINGRFQTSAANIYAIGDVVDGPMLAHKASEEGVAVAEIIAGENPHLNYLAIPSVVYTFPEVAAVGFTEEELKERQVKYKVGSFPLKANSRAVAVGEEEGLVKILADETTGILLGMHIIAPHAGELIHEGALAIEKRATVFDLANCSHAHPTLAEAIKEAALSIVKKAIHM
ncbi:MAG: dihydrolipoyl dehydrogenase [Candidatus Algichlamydia australiensis]|nr:dihydrolipoyl dehydrogenase [Chlamydiales bacterium]